jgi:hypothetical protein
VRNRPDREPFVLSAEENAAAGGDLTTQTHTLRAVVGKLAEMLGQHIHQAHK